MVRKSFVALLIILLIIPQVGVAKGIHFGIISAVKNKIDDLKKEISATGKVVSSTDEVIYGSMVSSGKNITVADQNGKFHIIASRDKINISAFGYYDQKRMIESRSG